MNSLILKWPKWEGKEKKSFTITINYNNNNNNKRVHQNQRLERELFNSLEYAFRSSLVPSMQKLRLSAMSCEYCVSDCSSMCIRSMRRFKCMRFHFLLPASFFFFNAFRQASMHSCLANALRCTNWFLHQLHFHNLVTSELSVGYALPFELLLFGFNFIDFRKCVLLNVFLKFLFTWTLSLILWLETNFFRQFSMWFLSDSSFLGPTRNKSILKLKLFDISLMMIESVRVEYFIVSAQLNDKNN